MACREQKPARELLARLILAVVNRRHDPIGFLQYVVRQVEAAVVLQASAVALVGLLVGIPLGVVVGRLAWGRVADGLGVATDAAVPTLALVLTVPAVLLVAVLVAALPARAAARRPVATTLRAE